MQTPVDLQRYAPVFVLAAVVIVAGAAILIGRLDPVEHPPVPPRAPLQQAQQQRPGGELPSDHPPLEIPAQVKDAIRALEADAEKAPDDAAKWKHLGEVQYRAAQLDRTYLEPARRTYTRVLERDPKDLDALRALGNIAFDQERPKEALELYTRYLEQRPEDLEVRTDLGTMHLAAGNTNEAVRTYESVLQQDPRFFQAQFNLAIAYRGAGQNEAAISALRRAVEIAPDETSRQQVQLLLGRLEGAAAAPAAPAGSASGDAFQKAIENIFRQNQVMASKVQRIEWTGPYTARLYLNDFPMKAMGEQMQAMFTDRMRSRFREQKQAHGVTATTRVALVDTASGEVMDTISE